MSKQYESSAYEGSKATSAPHADSKAQDAPVKGGIASSAYTMPPRPEVHKKSFRGSEPR